MKQIIGNKTNEAAINALLKNLNTTIEDDSAIIYIGYPIISTAIDTYTVPATLVSKKYGLVIFDIGESVLPITDSQSATNVFGVQRDLLYSAFQAKLMTYQNLIAGRKLDIPINILTYVSDKPRHMSNSDEELITDANFSIKITKLEKFDQKYYETLNAAIQRVSSIMPKERRDNAKTDGSRGSILKTIEKNIANLDSWQNKAAIETPNGPQRIRGLAGSGKTIVLALKAAYLHSQYPEWKIAVSFYSQSLYGQFEKLIQRFYFEDRRMDPNWEQIKLLHAYGSPNKHGLYSEICQEYGMIPKDFSYAKRTYGPDFAFQGICKELLAIVKKDPRELFDAVLIDEAQDLPDEFLNLAYHCTKNHRVIFAYDDLQNLGAYEMSSVNKLFDGSVDFSGKSNEPAKDIILPVCYRNTPWALATAHALGIGIYRQTSNSDPYPLIQHPDDPKLWTDIGYKVVAGKLNFGENVTLSRDVDSTPKFFTELLNSKDAIQFINFKDEHDQIVSVSNMIMKNLEEDEIYPQDILVIFPEAITAAKKGAMLVQFLRDRNITAHIAGIDFSRDVFFVPNSIAISGPHRAKGNEAPIVYLMDSQYCASGESLIKKRNTLFTAITRSRAWVRICGYGDKMSELETEFFKIQQNNFQLKFKIPTKEELNKIRIQHRDMTKEEEKDLNNLKRVTTSLMNKGVEPSLIIEQLPDKIKKELIKSLQEECWGDNDL
ncbi:DEAD/DEAH box helicase [Dehalococcoides sp. UCH007]|uniref:DEAD/DEAH box helicase n=1 Tax=Dehalococcoides sp. UCH007 TaxID=1522671 RepID=UPI0005B574D5|nr:ATP-binding domain-containing protein [Dehalococcoides sp. UCH007]BAQ35241.1 hypothetical protein UCH007_12830 [Dehalococcoides sp. UCH007]